MPDILIYHKSRVFNYISDQSSFRRTVTVLAAEVLSLPEAKVTPEDFSVIFHPLGLHDQLAVDIRVIVLADGLSAGYENRLEDADAKAEDIARALKEMMSSWLHLPRFEPTVIGVSIFGGKTGYARTEVAGQWVAPESRPYRRYTDAYDLGHGTPGP